MNYVLILGLNLLLIVSEAHILNAANQAPAVKADQQDDSQPPIYTPPKKPTPRARVGGPLRGTEGNEPEIVALVPDHVGLTIKQTPILNWYLPQPTTFPLRFTLNDTQKIRPVYEEPLPAPTHAGVQSIEILRPYGPRLSVTSNTAGSCPRGAMQTLTPKTPSRGDDRTMRVQRMPDGHLGEFDL